jgi:hypothetical protein
MLLATWKLRNFDFSQLEWRPVLGGLSVCAKSYVRNFETSIFFF